MCCGTWRWQVHPYVNLWKWLWDWCFVSWTYMYAKFGSIGRLSCECSIELPDATCSHWVVWFLDMWIVGKKLKVLDLSQQTQQDWKWDWIFARMESLPKQDMSMRQRVWSSFVLWTKSPCAECHTWWLLNVW